MHLYKNGLFLIVSTTCFYLTVTHIHVSKNSFRLPYYRTNLRTFLLCFQGPKIFNSLSSEIQNASSIAVLTSKHFACYKHTLLL